MKRSSGPRKTVKLSDCVHQQLNTYALAAGAAGVSLIALAHPAEAKIVYTPANMHIKPNTSYSLDLNHDGITDFLVPNLFTCCSQGQWRGQVIVSGPYHGPNQVVVSNLCAAALPAGKFVGHRLNFGNISAGPQMAYYQGPSFFACPWTDQKTHYLGLKFFIGAKINYGWARFRMTWVAHSGWTALLTGYAYETVPNKGIVAGRKKGPDSPDQGASLTSPVPDKPQPASLGALAMGAPGLAIWRREESLDPTQ